MELSEKLRKLSDVIWATLPDNQAGSPAELAAECEQEAKNLEAEIERLRGVCAYKNKSIDSLGEFADKMAEQRDAYKLESEKLREEKARWEKTASGAYQTVKEERDRLRQELEEEKEAHNTLYAEFVPMRERGGLTMIERDQLKQELAHWKANHNHIVEKLRFATQRPDLPVDRIPAMKELDRLRLENSVLGPHADQLHVERDELRATLNIAKTLLANIDQHCKLQVARSSTARYIMQMIKDVEAL